MAQKFTIIKMAAGESEENFNLQTFPDISHFPNYEIEVIN